MADKTLKEDRAPEGLRKNVDVRFKHFLILICVALSGLVVLRGDSIRRGGLLHPGPSGLRTPLKHFGTRTLPGRDSFGVRRFERRFEQSTNDCRNRGSVIRKQKAGLGVPHSKRLVEGIQRSYGNRRFFADARKNRRLPELTATN